MGLLLVMGVKVNSLSAPEFRGLCSYALAKLMHENIDETVKTQNSKGSKDFTTVRLNHSNFQKEKKKTTPQKPHQPRSPQENTNQSLC